MLDSFIFLFFPLKKESRNRVHGLSTRRVNIIDNVMVHAIYESNVRGRDFVYINVDEAMLFIIMKCVRYKPNDNSPSLKKNLFENTLAIFIFVLTININSIADIG